MLSVSNVLLLFANFRLKDYNSLLAGRNEQLAFRLQEMRRRINEQFDILAHLIRRKK